MRLVFIVVWDLSIFRRGGLLQNDGYILKVEPNLARPASLKFAIKQVSRFCMYMFWQKRNFEFGTTIGSAYSVLKYKLCIKTTGGGGGLSPKEEPHEYELANKRVEEEKLYSSLSLAGVYCVSRADTVVGKENVSEGSEQEERIGCCRV